MNLTYNSVIFILTISISPSLFAINPTVVRLGTLLLVGGHFINGSSDALPRLEEEAKKNPALPKSRWHKLKSAAIKIKNQLHDIMLI